MMATKRSKGVVKNALDVEAVRLLKADPDKYYEGRKLPFGFAVTDKAKEAVRSTNK